MSSIKWKIAQFLEIRWWHSYLRNKRVDDYLDWKLDYWKDFLRKIKLEVPTSSTVLDAGCGPSGIFTMLKDQHVTAIDPLLDKYENEIPHFSKSQYPTVEFYTAQLENWTTHLSFDYIFCINAINHVSDIEAAVFNLKKLLHEKGKLILSIDAHNSKIIKWLLKIIPGDVLHPHQMDIREYEALLEKTGFKIADRFKLKKGIIFGYWVLIAEKNNSHLNQYQ